MLRSTIGPWVFRTVCLGAIFLFLGYLGFQQNNIMARLQDQEERILVQSTPLKEQETSVEPTLATASPPADNTDPSTSKKTASETIISILKQMQGNLEQLDSRITSMEDELELKRLDEGALSEQDSAEENIRDPDTDPELIAANVVRQEARKQYFLDVENTIFQTADDEFTQQVNSSFQALVESNEKWVNLTSVQSTDCGNEFCKVVLNYSKDLDPISQFEFDGMAYIWNKDLPRAKAIYQTRSDGSTDIIMYFAKTGSRLPVFQ